MLIAFWDATQIKFGETRQWQTQVCAKSLNPQWNSEFRIEVPNDIELQDFPIEFKYVLLMPPNPPVDLNNFNACGFSGCSTRICIQPMI